MENLLNQEPYRGVDKDYLKQWTYNLLNEINIPYEIHNHGVHITFLSKTHPESKVHLYPTTGTYVYKNKDDSSIVYGSYKAYDSHSESGIMTNIKSCLRNAIEEDNWYGIIY